MGTRFSSVVIVAALSLTVGCGSTTSADPDAAGPTVTINSAGDDEGAQPTSTARPGEEIDGSASSEVDRVDQSATTTAKTTTPEPETTGPETTTTTAVESADGSDTDDSNTDDSDQDLDIDEGDEGDESEEPVELTPVWPGDSGDSVMALQERLDELGFAPGTADGDYGGRTTRSIKAFQGLVGLSRTGWADSPTLAALDTYRYDGLVLRSGDEGDDVIALQERLALGPLDPGPADGEYGGRTIQAVWALEKLADIPVDGDWGPLDEKALADLESARIGGPQKDHDQRWVEVDLSRQLMKVYDPGEDIPVLVSHASSGSGVPWSNEDHSGSSVTPLGDFQINRRVNGWRESSLNIGRLYNPLYFNGGIALHGASSVPLYPASHGCIRLPMHIADYLPGELPNGTPVHVMA